MIRAAYWTCALLAIAHAHIYERCELARELTSLGVDREHLSTWVCITYHESRFDTAAQNHYSGDHGLFQISEQYWCGPGKACGLPCSALRDEDISNDLECALSIHKEHTRLQGDGFLAWVVYPQHCKHNTKKYIVDCDSQLKNATVRTSSRSRSFSNPYVRNNTYEYNSNIDNLKPPYLTVNSIVRGTYGKMLEDKSHQKNTPFNWINYKIDNIDELTLPVFNNQYDGLPRLISTTTTTTTTTVEPTTSTSTTTAYPPIKVWRRIETNQFRKKQVIDKKPTPTKWLELGKPANHVDFVTPSTLVDSVTKSIVNNNSVGNPSRSDTTTSPTPVTNFVPSTRKLASSNYPTSGTFSTTKTLPAIFTTNTPYSTTIKTTSKQFTFTSPTAYSTTSKASTKPFVVTTNTARPTETKASPKPFLFITTTPIPTTTKASIKPFTFTTLAPTTAKLTSKPLYFATTTPNPITIKPSVRPFTFTTTTAKPTTAKVRTEGTSSTIKKYKPFIFTTIKPSIQTTEATTKRISTTGFKVEKRPSVFAFTSRSNLVPSSTEPTERKNGFKTVSYSSTAGPKTNFHISDSSTTTIRPRFTTQSYISKTSFDDVQTSSTLKPSTLSTSTYQSLNDLSNPNKSFRSSRTSRLLSQRDILPPVSTSRLDTFTTSKPLTSPVTTSAPFRSVTTVTPTSKTSRSIFDLYLSPTQWPKLPTYRFPELSNSGFKLKIFSGGTTTPAPQYNIRRTFAPPGEAARNHVRRQTLQT